MVLSVRASQLLRICVWGGWQQRQRVLSIVFTQELGRNGEHLQGHIQNPAMSVNITL